MLSSPAARSSHSSTVPRTSAAFCAVCAAATSGKSNRIPIVRIRVTSSTRYHARCFLRSQCRWQPGLFGEVDAELLEFLGVVSAEQQVPLFTAFGDFALLRADLLACRAVHLILGHQYVRHMADNLQANGVAVLVFEAKVAILAQHLDDLVRNVADLVAREFHCIAGVAARGANHLALGDQRLLNTLEHLLITDPLAPHVFAVLAKQ